MRRPRGRLASLATALVLAVASGCSDEPPLPRIVWEGEHLRFGTGSLLFPSAPSDRPSYRGRWGVRVDRDPLSMRSGIRFPDWRAEIIDAILRAG